jgi:hypothetical protein
MFLMCSDVRWVLRHRLRPSKLDHMSGESFDVSHWVLPTGDLGGGGQPLVEGGRRGQVIRRTRSLFLHDLWSVRFEADATHGEVILHGLKVTDLRRDPERRHRVDRDTKHDSSNARASKGSSRLSGPRHEPPQGPPEPRHRFVVPPRGPKGPGGKKAK